MLGNKDAVATIAVRDLAAARQFYEGTLGLKLLAAEGQEVLVFQSGSSRVNVYRSGFAGSNQGGRGRTGGARGPPEGQGG